MFSAPLLQKLQPTKRRLMKTFILLSLGLSSLSWANQSSTKPLDQKTQVADSIKDSDFRCERFMGRELSRLKTRLLENCDLNKPFSSSLSVFTGEDTFLYCCHTKTPGQN